MKPVKAALQTILRPFREAAGRFVLLPKIYETLSQESIFFKAAEITSAELVDGDYLEFGVFRGASFVNAFQTLKRVYEQRTAESRKLPR